MGTCFVMQPFDGSVFDKRYEDVFVHAIEQAGLEPYRVDRDPNVSIPIDNIEAGIRNAEVCLAEITTDNPNVWFELGYAIAIRKEVVLICSDERESKFPFDVQHRRIIKYNTDSPSDFDTLKESIAERLIAIVKKQSEWEKLSPLPISETEGLSPHEIAALVTIMQNKLTSEDKVPPYQIKEDMIKAGYNELAVSLSLASLKRKGLIHEVEDQDYEGRQFNAYVVSSEGENWLLKNQDKLTLYSSEPS